MEGTLQVGEALAEAATGTSIVRNLTQVPTPVGDREPQLVKVALTAKEVTGLMIRVRVGDTVRIFFGVAGPNKTSSFHVVGEIFDRAYQYGSLTTEPLTDVQTVSVPPGSAWMVELTLEVPGTYVLVDHAMSRMERGLAAHLVVEGEEQPEIYHPGPE